MPRPKRSKVAPSAPTSILARKAAVKSAIPRHLSSPKSTQSITNSDDSDGLVKRNATGKNGRGVIRQEVQMSGALPESSDGSTTRRKPVGGKARSALTKAAREEPRTAYTGAKGPLDSQPIAEHVSEMQVPASFPEEAKSLSSPDAQSSPKENVFASAMKRPASSVGFNWRTQATPQADSSVVSKFKRRPRQPSILGIGRADESLSMTRLDDVANEDTLGGDGEPSRIARLDFTIYDELSDFEPDNESTPYGVAKDQNEAFADSTRHKSVSRSSTSRSSPVLVTSRRHARVPSSSGPRFESQLGTSGHRESSSLLTSGSRKRKITPPEVLVPQSQHLPEPSDVVSESDQEPTVAHLEEEDLVLPSPKRQAVTETDIFSETMASPMSSSPEPSRQPHATRSISPPKLTTAHGRGRPKRNQLPKTPASASASKKGSKIEPLKPLSTATLQSLLPRRRTAKAYDNYDIPSDRSPSPIEQDDNEDELSYSGPRRRKTGRNATVKSKKTPADKAKSTKPAARSRATAPTAASVAKAKHRMATKTAATNKPTKTYSRRASDKENRPQEISSGDVNDSNDSLSPETNLDVAENTSNTSMDLPADARRELAKVTKKFKEVDNWEMEFEEVTASSSSPKDAR